MRSSDQMESRERENGVGFSDFLGFSLSLTRTDNVCFCFLFSLSLSLKQTHTLTLSFSFKACSDFLSLSLSLLLGGTSFIGLCEFVGWFYLYAPASTSHKKITNYIIPLQFLYLFALILLLSKENNNNKYYFIFRERENLRN